MKNFELFIALLLVALRWSATASNASQNACPSELKPCKDLVKEYKICSHLNDICSAIANGNSCHVISSFEAGRCNGSVFCPLTQECLPQNNTCNVNTTSTRFRRPTTPWGVNCSGNQEFCSVSMSCIAVNSTCSLRALFDWHLAGNTSYGPYGQVCYAGKTFCLASMSCIASVNATCEVPYNASAFGSFCGNHEKFCAKRGGCIDNNSTCNAFSAVNMTGRPDPGRGWQQMCRVRQSVCTRILDGLSHCYPKVSHCGPHNSSSSPPQPSCCANQTFCAGAGRCIYSNESCCPAGQSFCSRTSRCHERRELCCPQHQFFCNATTSCINNTDHCCAFGRYHCQLEGRCIPFHEPCTYKAPSDPCPPSASHCKKLILKSNLLCESRFSVCDALVNGNASTFSREVSTVNGMACHDNKTYCPLSNDCIPAGTSCTLDCKTSNASLSTPWGKSCPVNESFCGQTMQCEGVCSARGIYDWIANGNTTYGPRGQICNDTSKFCLATMSCIGTNETCVYNVRAPHGNRSASNGNDSHIDDLCRGRDNFCLRKLKCVSGGEPCNAFPSLNYTGVNDSRTGWKEACQISNAVCQRKKYAIDKCFPIVGKCLVERNVTKYSCFAPRFVYCNHTQRCINASDHCCPPGQTYCPDQNRCQRNGDKCKFEVCEDTPCGHLLQKNRMCEKLDEVCPVIVHAPRNLTSVLNNMYNSSSPKFNCKQGEKFCFVSDRCQSDPCELNLDDNGTLSESPWGQPCPPGKEFCKFTMSCMTRGKTCSLRALLDWMNAGNTSVSPCGKVCAVGQKFCMRSYSCISNMDNCSIPVPIAFNATNNMTTLDLMCGPYHRYCPIQFRCVRKTEPCVTPRLLNYTGASDNGTGYLIPCRLKDVYCPRVVYGALKCGAGRNFSHCLRKDLERCRKGSYFCDLRGKCLPNREQCTQCPDGESFCSRISKCIRSSDFCLAPGECPPYQKDCPELGGCINKTIRCEPDIPPASDVIYKTVWYFEQLDTVKPSLFTSGQTIAVISVSNNDGRLMCHDGTAWAAASGISPSNAFVLGKTYRINFLPFDSSFHGVILVNYTVIAGTPGQNVDASSSARTPDNVIAIVIVPHFLPPILTKLDKPCIFKEDSRRNDFALEDRINMTVRNVSKDSNIPSDVLPFLKRATVKYYFNRLNFLRRSRYAIAAIDLENSRRRGSFIGDSPASLATPVIKQDLCDRLNFVPTLNYHGPLNASFVGVTLFSFIPGFQIKTLQLSTRVFEIINTLLQDKNASTSVREAYYAVLNDLQAKDSAPSKANFMSSIDALLATASGGERQADLNTVKSLISKTFEAAALENNGAEQSPPRFAPVAVTLTSGKFFVMFDENTIDLGCSVLPINDAPELTSYTAFFPPIAYNLSVTPNTGFQISEMTTRIPIPYGSTKPKLSKLRPLIQDVDNDEPGIAVVFAKNSSIGAYYYKTAGSSWQLVDLNNTLVNGKLMGESQVLLLKPTSRLKFQMHDPNLLWSNTVAREKANLLFAAWDQSDNQTDGVHNFFFPTDGNSSISRKFASAFTARLGCDNEPGSRGRIDTCGRCGGDGLWCRGCDGVKFSGAKIDRCDNCTGGTTNKTFNFRLDCGGGCGSSFYDECGFCQEYGKVTNFTDCNGVCYGTAEVNKCGVCVLGTTGKAATFGQDACGVCGGANNTCLDCAGTPNGTKEVDMCGNCLEPTDSRFDSGCIKLGNISPISGRHNIPTSVKIVGAGLQSYSTATCQMFNETGGIYNLAAVVIQNKRFVISTPTAYPGKYQVKCKFDSSSTYYETLNNFTFYDTSVISYTSITPNETEAGTGPLNVTITGSGFPDTGYVRCTSNKKFSSPAVLIDSSTVKCLFPNVPKSADLRISVSFGEADNDVGVGSSLGFQFYAVSPHPLSVVFETNLQALIVIMNKPSKHSGTSCRGAFSPASKAKFGSRAKCVLRTPYKLFIILLGRPSISPGDTVTFISGSLTRKFEDVTKNISCALNLTIQGPPRAIVPTAELAGPNKVGVCGQLKLDASGSSGSGGRRLTFTWYVDWASDQDMAAVAPANGTQDLDAINTLLSGLPPFSPRVRLSKSYLKLDLKYEFKVKVRNFLGEESANSTLVVVRENKQLPIIDAGRAKREVKASRDVTIQARAILSPCLDGNAVSSTVLFSWEIDGVGIDLGVKNKPRLKIKKGTLQGGKRYTLTVRAAMASDQTLFSTKTIVLDVKSSPIVAKIRGGSLRGVGSSDTLKLDGSRSFDPDKSSETAWYKWECADSSGKPCSVPDPSVAGRKIRMVLPATAKVSIDVASKLESNKKYKFTLTYSKGARKASKSVVINVQPGNPPEVEIKPQKKAKENPTSITMIKSVAKSTMATTNVTWECVEEEGFGFVDLIASGVAQTPLSFTFKKKSGKKVSKNFALVIAANALADGVDYKFRVNVAHADSSMVGETIITTNAAPSQGVLDVSPSNGTAMDTLYTISATEDWSDDKDDLPLKYQFGYFKKGSSGKEILLGMFGESSEKENVKFPPGDPDNSNTLTVFVDCKDALGAVTRQTATVTVMPKAITAAFLSQAQDDVLKSLDSGEWNSAIGNAGAIMSSLPSGSSDPNQTAAVTAMKEAFANGFLLILQNGGVADDPESKGVMYESMGSITDGGSAMSESSKNNIKDTILAIEIGVTSSKRRRRREVSNSGASVETYSVAQAKTTISLISNLIDPNLYDASTMSMKASLLPVLDSSGKKVCAGLALGMSAAIVKDKLVVLRSEKNSLVNADTTFTKMACDDSPEILQKSAKIKLGSTLQTEYSSWNCSGGDTLCSGVCLISSQQIYDLLSSGPNNKTLTNVVDFKLYNPETYAAISISTLATPVSYRLPVFENATLSNVTYFQCKRWDSVNSAWTGTGCVTNPTLIIADNGTRFIECSCTQVGYLAAFQTDSPPPTEPPATVLTTQLPTLTPSLAPAIPVRRARIVLIGDYDTLVTPAKAEQFKMDVIAKLATTMRVNESRIVNVTLSKGSIIVVFALLPGPSDDSVSLKAAIDYLETAIKSNNFTVTLSDGTVLKADPNAFSTTEGDVYPTGAPQPQPAELDSGLTETEIIIISVVCGLLVVVLLVVIVVVCYKNKSRKISPESSRVQLRGDVEMEDREKVDGNYNEAYA